MPLIDQSTQIVFVKVPKTAGTSVLLTFLHPHGFTLSDWDNEVVVNLNRVDGFRISDRFRMPDRTKRYNGWHVSARDLRRYLGADATRYRWFTVVRHPYDRLVSTYEFQRAKGRELPDFHRFVEAVAGSPHELHRQVQLHTIPQSDWLRDAGGAPLVEHVLKWEQLPSCFERLREAWDLPSVELGQENESDRRRPVRSYLDSAATRSIVDQLYADDFRLLGYPADLDAFE
jgi:Sulfotransferase family